MLRWISCIERVKFSFFIKGDETRHFMKYFNWVMFIVNKAWQTILFYNIERYLLTFRQPAIKIRSTVCDCKLERGTSTILCIC
jgi:hypothetical protein